MHAVMFANGGLYPADTGVTLYAVSEADIARLSSQPQPAAAAPSIPQVAQDFYHALHDLLRDSIGCIRPNSLPVHMAGEVLHAIVTYLANLASQGVPRSDKEGWRAIQPSKWEEGWKHVYSSGSDRNGVRRCGKTSLPGCWNTYLVGAVLLSKCIDDSGDSVHVACEVAVKCNAEVPTLSSMEHLKNSQEQEGSVQQLVIPRLQHMGYPTLARNWSSMNQLLRMK